MIPAQSRARPKPTEAETLPIILANGREALKAAAVPRRAKATCTPIAKAIS